MGKTKHTRMKEKNMKLAKIAMFVMVAALLTGVTAVADPLIITIDENPKAPPNAPKISITVSGNENPDSPGNDVGVGQGIGGQTRMKMNEAAVGMSKLTDSGMIVISNPCAWVYIGGKWYWRCW